MDNFKKYGPPSIPIFPISKKEQEARTYFFQEEYDICGQVDILDDLYLHEDDELMPDHEDQGAGETVDMVHTCCNSFAEEDSKLRDMKHWYKQIEGGTTVEYRCPACRECSKCKNSDTTEKISLREEVEQKAVEDSVHFDRENKKVMVELPKRGEEEFFLTSKRYCQENVSEDF